eukprot:TRINITY_DN7824_c0_g1_i1.p1 TRINITY_DN7824_c0_g1~~TRINITY_DN7824_c0_g1_i1.p1  ORF type:complete len:170 (-),score=11.34 TRINITY_DN7824_c0_g1_i1:626-1135(-)
MLPHLSNIYLLQGTTMMRIRQVFNVSGGFLLPREETNIKISEDSAEVPVGDYDLIHSSLKEPDEYHPIMPKRTVDNRLAPHLSMDISGTGTQYGLLFQDDHLSILTNKVGELKRDMKSMQEQVKSLSDVLAVLVQVKDEVCVFEGTCSVSFLIFLIIQHSEEPCMKIIY